MNATSQASQSFEHPADGWYMVEPLGEHPNAAAGVVQVIDAEATQTIARNFGEAAAQPGFAGLLVDQEHFSHEPEKESRAFGWLTALEARADGLYGQIRWTDTGRAAVDGGDYRFFSTEYEAQDLEAAPEASVGAQEAGMRRVRPTRLAGLALTNRPNNRGGRPITNSGRMDRTDRTDRTDRADQGLTGAAEGASAANETANRKTIMTRVTNKLGLAAEASEDAILAAVTEILNRAERAEQALAEAKANAAKVHAENQKLREAQLEGDLARFKNRIEPKQQEFIKGLLLTNRDATIEYLESLPWPAKRDGGGTVAVSRGTARTPADRGTGPGPSPLRQAVEEYRIKNRCAFEEAWNAVKREKPELFEAVAS